MASLPQNRFGEQPNSPPTATWTGQSGRNYTFHLYPLGTVFKPNYPGVYGFFERRGDGLWRVHYFGETECFNQRVGAGLASHHKWDAVVKSAATHVGLLVIGGARTERLTVESDLCQRCKPPLNG